MVRRRDLRRCNAEKTYSILKKGIVFHRTEDFEQRAERLRNHPKWDRLLKLDLSGSVRQFPLWGPAAVQHPDLFDRMLGEKNGSSEQIELVVGPPGTGKTRSITERIYDSLSIDKPCVSLRCAWTNVATENSLNSLLKYAIDKTEFSQFPCNALLKLVVSFTGILSYSANCFLIST